jgi:hypothetical protein
MTVHAIELLRHHAQEELGVQKPASDLMFYAIPILCRRAEHLHLRATL